MWGVVLVKCVKWFVWHVGCGACEVRNVECGGDLGCGACEVWNVECVGCG